MQLPLYVVDAFAARRFQGNPAAVCPLPRWLPDAKLQAIAAENNLAETAFLVRRRGAWELRWFTPVCEVAMCGHATLASGHVLYEHFGERAPSQTFRTLSGELVVSRRGTRLALELPVRAPRPRKLDARFAKALGAAPLALFEGIYALVVFRTERQVRELAPDFALVSKLHPVGVSVTAPGSGKVDFVSRFFAPAAGLPEDPVTGSAHATLVPYWAARLRKPKLVARQVSKRGGELECELAGERVILVGRAHTYLQGAIQV